MTRLKSPDGALVHHVPSLRKFVLPDPRGVGTIVI
jgi:hypothetical protein